MECSGNDPKPPKLSLPPIKVIGQTIEAVSQELNKNKFTDYLVKKISIGVKIICQSLDTYNGVLFACQQKKFQFFSHASKADRAFKVILYGLDHVSSEDVKAELIKMQLKCKEVKKITKTINNYIDTFFIVYFDAGSVKLSDLRQNVRSLFKTIVRWEYQRRAKNKISQCRSCQMFGHGESNCYVGALCANCSGKHKTADCNVSDRVRCANCHEHHKATDPSCPNRLLYLQIRERVNSRNSHKQNQNVRRYAENITFSSPHQQVAGNATARQITVSQTITHASQKPSYSAVAAASAEKQLFSEEEISQLTIDVISKLKVCRSKEEQFHVITQLAIKYLYSK